MYFLCLGKNATLADFLSWHASAANEQITYASLLQPPAIVFNLEPQAKWRAGEAPGREVGRAVSGGRRRPYCFGLLGSPEFFGYRHYKRNPTFATHRWQHLIYLLQATFTKLS